MRIAPTLAVAACAMLGYAVAAVFSPHAVGRMLPWVLGRGLGIGAYVALTVLTVFGMWLRHPWRVRWRRPSPESQLRVHATVAALTLLLLAGHVLALVLDAYAGVGWRGAFVPNASTYRPIAVTLGTLSLYLGLLVGGTAALAGRLVGRAWLPVHRVAGGVFALACAHGVLAGSDTTVLWWMYAGSACAVAVLAGSRRFAAAPAPHVLGGAV